MKHLYLFLLLSIGFFYSTYGQNLQRVIAFGGMANDEYAFYIAVDSQGNTYTAGYFTSYNFADFDAGPDTFSMLSTNRDAFIVKNDSAGNFIWAKQIGGNSHQEAYRVVYDGTNGLYITGSFIGTVDFDPGPGVFNMTGANPFDNGLFLLKLDTAGNFVWAKSNGINGVVIDLDSAKNIYVTGNFYSVQDFDPGVGTYNLTPSGSSDIGIQKLDSNGNLKWAKKLGSIFGEDLGSLKVDLSGNIYLTGNFSGSLDLNPAAGVFTINSNGAEDVYILKLDSSGSFVWGKNFGSQSSDYSGTISIDSWGNVYTAGIFTDITDFDPGLGTFDMNVAGVSEGSGDIFIQKLDSAGNFIWAKRIGSIFDENIGGLTVDQAGNLYFRGIYNDVVDFDPGPGFSFLPGPTGSFLLKLDSAGTFGWVTSSQATISNIALSHNERIHIVGNYSTSVSAGSIVPCNFDPLNTNFSLYGQYPGTYTTDLYIAMYSPQPTNILPVQLTQFTATPKQTEVLLEWQTASEIHSNYFIIERSKDVKTWAEFTRVKAAGSSSFSKDYNTTDEQPYSGTSYYRLTQVDLDGSFTYSPVRTVNFGNGKGEIKVYPNPATDHIILSTSKDIVTDDIRMYNSTGQDVTGRVTTRQTGIGSYEIDMTKLATDTYILSSGAAGKTMVTKL